MSTPLIGGDYRNTAAGGHWSTSPILKAGKCYVRQAGAWVAVQSCQVAPAQRNTGTPLSPVWVEDWTLAFSDAQPTTSPASVTVVSDNHALTENPGDPGKTAHVTWTNNGEADYYRVAVDWYRNGVLDSTTTALASAHTCTSNAIYHHEASDFSYLDDTLHVVIRFVNPFASAPHEFGPTVTTSDQNY